MGYLKIHCRNCRGSFEMYWDDIETKDKARCPHCLTVMDAKQWEKLVNAYFTLEEVNKGLKTRHTEHREPLMQAEYKTHYVHPKAYRTGDYGAYEQ